MASSKEYLNFILGQLSGLEEITYKPMMGEFIIYYRGKIVGGKFETKKYWLEKSKLYGKQAILRWLQKENIDTTPNSWQERYHL